jgi:hypothetical protein
MEIGIDSFAAILRDPKSGIEISPAERLANLLDEVQAADEAGIDIRGRRASSARSSWIPRRRLFWLRLRRARKTSVSQAQSRS